MKKTISLLLILSLLLTGCGSSAKPDVTYPDITTQATTSEESTEPTADTTIGTTVDTDTTDRQETSEATTEETATEAITTSSGASTALTTAEEPHPSSATTPSTEEKATEVTTTTEAVTTQTQPKWIIEDTDEEWYATKDLNVREEPKSGANRITHVDEGDLVYVTGWVDNGWARIRIKGGEYYISGKYLSKEKPVEEEIPMRAEKIGDKEVIYDQNMTLTFIDEFEGKRLDFSKWDYCPDWERSDRGGKWDQSQVKVEDGKLVLSTDFDEEKGHHVSGAIRSKGLFEQAYGYFECSMKVQNTPGFWSAFWLITPTVSRVGKGAVDGVEIDIMEAYSFDKKGLNFALHWDGYGAQHKSTGKGTIRSDLYDGNYHTYACMWADDMYIWYVDGVECWRTDEPGICEVPAYLKLTLEVGSWAGETDKSQLPDHVFVDYVRVYQFDSKI